MIIEMFPLATRRNLKVIDTQRVTFCPTLNMKFALQQFKPQHQRRTKHHEFNQTGMFCRASILYNKVFVLFCPPLYIYTKYSYEIVHRRERDLCQLKEIKLGFLYPSLPVKTMNFMQNIQMCQIVQLCGLTVPLSV